MQQPSAVLTLSWSAVPRTRLDQSLPLPALRTRWTSPIQQQEQTPGACRLTEIEPAHQEVLVLVFLDDVGQAFILMHPIPDSFLILRTDTHRKAG